jgi:hypothetical protein
LAALFLCSACNRHKEPPLSYGAKPSVDERVRVLNADVLVIDDVDTRLANGYGPQPLPYAKCWAEAVLANEAVNELKSLVSTAKTIQVRPTGGRDEYNRRIAYISLDGLDLGDTLFSMGLVAQKPKGPFDWCAPLSAETEGAPPLRSLMSF